MRYITKKNNNPKYKTKKYGRHKPKNISNCIKDKWIKHSRQKAQIVVLNKKTRLGCREEGNIMGINGNGKKMQAKKRFNYVLSTRDAL